MKDTPELTEARGCIVIPWKGRFVVLGGNMRLAAAKAHLDWTELMCAVLPENTSADKMRQIVQKDNSSFGEFDYDILRKEWLDFDYDILRKEWLDFGYDYQSWGMHFDTKELEIEEEAKDDNFDVDRAAAAIKTPVTQRGDIWQLGDHYLMCGDSTSAEDVARLMDGTRADLSVTDPPYNVAYEGGTKDKLKIENDKMSDSAFHDFLVAAFTRMNEALKPGAANYVFFACKEARNFIDAYIASGFLYKQLLIWVKNSITLTRSDYQWQHEPCIYGWKDGAPHYFTDDRTLHTVVDEWPDFDKMDKAALRDFCKRVFDKDALATDIVREDKPTRNAEHPTMKPIPLIGRFVRNSSQRGQSVIDLFGGSGSTLMACEQLKRQCRTMEYDPVYCDVIIARWEKYTGRKATKIE
ncbi:MAG: site-specific DNA-methyltransferase [Clostridia bacterium]|nr:site-specific DNA-methyltransferase [Clostridia bacterium]